MEEEAKKEKLGWAALLFGGAALCSVLIANAAVLARYVFMISLPSSEEILRYLFIWLIFICAALSFREGTLIRITILDDMLRQRPVLRRLLAVFQNLLILGFSLVSIYTGWEMLSTQIEFEELSVVLEINMGWVTAGVLIGYALLAWFSLCNIFDALRRKA